VLAGTRRLVGASNQLFADLLAHLAEVESRGIHRIKACASLYTYCIYELRFSEDAAFRRATAARLVKAFPALFDAVANGELHLTGLLMIGPHLTASNQHEVLARAKHRTKKELTKLVRELAPLPDVPSRIAPLGPAPPPRSPLRNPTWLEYVTSMVPVRHLQPGERPSEWVDEATIANALLQSEGTPANEARTSVPCSERDIASETAVSSRATRSPEPPAEPEDTGVSAPIATGCEPTLAPARLTGPQRYSVQFTASQEYADLVERARALLSHTGQTALEELHLQAMRYWVAQLEKRKYGAPPRKTDPVVENETRQPATGRSETTTATRTAIAIATTTTTARGIARRRIFSG